MKWSSVFFLPFLLLGAFGFDYDVSPMEDPLQPIWKRLESLSADILQGFQVKMQAFQQQTQDNIEAKFQSLKAELSASSSSAGDATDSNSIANNVKEAVTAWMENFYQNTMKSDNDEVVVKAERSIKVRIDALENKLIEHINVKIDSLKSTAASDGTNTSGTAIIPTGSQVSDLQTAIINHITTKLTDVENSINTRLSQLATSMESSSSKLTTISTHVTKLTEVLVDNTVTPVSGGSDTSTTISTGGTTQSCTALVNKVTQLMNKPQLTTEFVDQQESRWKEIQSVIAEVRETPSYLPRDCSDIHWLHHDAASGVYQIYPTIDRKNSVMAWCDMAENRDKSDGGWTIILRRRNATDYGLLDFNRTWQEYADGFGDPAEGEWWFSLTSLHALTYRQPYNMQFHMTDIEDGPFYADYKIFRVEDEAHKFKLIVDGFTGNVSMDAFKSKHHGRSFSTPDADNDNYEGGSCALNNAGGWWFDACHYTTLTAPYPMANDREARTIRWRIDTKWLLLTDVIMKIRPSGYGARFEAHTYDE